ncbi:hypothetical protein [Caulobacter hibisci]|uniref:Uncharacterized protein n=1 Tax=Caulobacter hibisci TaxID=2035993 RepID=A0ABS0SWT9_9CAUL|nr:hypothetical protein [Caulobacter hibisci]MBI1684064.1 hypothetical protein [Caulobacter hibisci]
MTEQHPASPDTPSGPPWRRADAPHAAPPPDPAHESKRPEPLFRLGVAFYVMGMATGLAGLAVFGRLVPLSGDPIRDGILLCLGGLILMVVGRLLRNNTRGR